METKEAQEAHLLALYNSTLQQLVKNNKAGAKTYLLEITNSSLFSQAQCRPGEGSEQIQKTLCYYVHKNLGECFMDESDFQKAEDHFFEASQIDRTDVTPFGSSWLLPQSSWAISARRGAELLP